MNQIREHRHRYNLDIPYECNGFKIDDYVEYSKDGKIQRGYIMCFRKFGYNWFAWIYFDKNIFQPDACIYVKELSKIEDK